MKHTQKSLSRYRIWLMLNYYFNCFRNARMETSAKTIHTFKMQLSIFQNLYLHKNTCWKRLADLNQLKTEKISFPWHILVAVDVVLWRWTFCLWFLFFQGVKGVSACSSDRKDIELELLSRQNHSFLIQMSFPFLCKQILDSYHD